MRYFRFIPALALLFLPAIVLADESQHGKLPYDKFQSPTLCATCHVDIARQHEQSRKAPGAGRRALAGETPALLHVPHRVDHRSVDPLHDGDGIVAAFDRVDLAADPLEIALDVVDRTNRKI